MHLAKGSWSRRILHSVALLTILAVGLTACGGGDGGDEGKASPTAAAASEVQEYCTAVLAVETISEPDIDFDAMTPEQQQAEAKKFATQSIRPLADEIVANAPDEIKEEIDVLNNAVKEVENTGDFEVFEKPEVVKASTAAHEFDLQNCGWEKAEVTAIDYTFSGVPSSLDKGATSFEFSNNGAEHHEMAIFRKNDDTTETFDELFALPEAEAEKKVSFVAATDAMPKEEGVYTVANLKEGQYAVVCFIPVGSTPAAEKAAEEAKKEIEGPPHVTRGMKSEFTVS
jgi:hypothetical protein